MYMSPENSGVQFEDKEVVEAPSTIDLSQIKKGFLLSRIEVSSDGATNDPVYSESEIAKIKNDLGAEEIPHDEAQKFGLEDHPLHREHMEQPDEEGLAK